MTDELSALDVPLVLHVVPSARARGAQREARALADHLDRPGIRAHRVLSLSDGPEEVPVDATLTHPGDGSPTVGFDPRLALTLRAGLRRMDPDVVVAHGSEPLKYLVPSMTGRRRPLAYYAIGTYSGSGRAAQLAVWRLLLKRADVVAAEGDEVRTECVERLGVPAAHVVLAPNGRDPEVFRPRSSRTAGPPTLLFVGALTAGKGPDRFIDLVSQLRSDGVDLEAQVAGDGPLADGLAGPARAAAVSLLGPRTDVAEVMGRADLLVFPSRPAGEGMPGVLIEAGMAGLPVVATDVPGVRSIVRDGETGLVVPVDDPGALASATAHLLGDPARRAAMGQAARRHCRAHFSLDDVAERWLSILEPLLASSTGAGSR
jgi:glycosyltransferase involved in cell wall biosynthesis